MKKRDGDRGELDKIRRWRRGGQKGLFWRGKKEEEAEGGLLLQKQPHSAI